MPRTTTEDPLPPPPLPTRRKRSLRCLRCAARKFRTPRDLALHILSKHGHVHVPPADDARSVTLSSPLIASSDVAELDALLLSAEHERENKVPNLSRDHHQRPCEKQQQQQPKRKHALQKHPRQQQPPRRGISKREWSWTSSSAPASGEGSDERSPRRVHRCAGESVDSSSEAAAAVREGENVPAEGESTGPRAKDVYLARCLSGRIPLVPIQPPTPVMLNFANGLF